MIRLTNGQWERIRNHFPEEHMPDGRPGRKPIPTRRVFEAVLGILNTGAQWHMLPQSYPNYKSVHRRFQTWCRDEVLRRVLMDVANGLRDKGALDEAECFIDATFVMAKGGGVGIGPTKRGKGMKIMAIVDRHGLPLSVSKHAANHHEVRLGQLCFDFYMIEAKPENFIADPASGARPPHRGVAKGRHRDDRAASQQQKQAAHARSATAKPLYATLARGALLCLDSMAAPHPRPLGILRPELPRLRTARLPRCPLQAILRQVLVSPLFRITQHGLAQRRCHQLPALGAHQSCCLSELANDMQRQEVWFIDHLV